MIADTILHKYVRHLRDIDQRSVVHLDTIELAMRLALEELAASIPSTPSTTDQRQAERDRAQLDRLNDWLAQHEPAACIVPGDTADAVLSVLASYRSALAQPSAISNQQSPFNNPPFVPPDPAATPNPPPAPLPIDLSSLAPDELQQVVTVQSGAKPWRTLDKPLRIKVASLTLRQLASAAGRKLYNSEWDNQRPPWMPASNAIALMFGVKWSEVPQE